MRQIDIQKGIWRGKNSKEEPREMERGESV